MVAGSFLHAVAQPVPRVEDFKRGAIGDDLVDPAAGNLQQSQMS